MLRVSIVQQPHHVALIDACSLATGSSGGEPSGRDHQTARQPQIGTPGIVRGLYADVSETAVGKIASEQGA